MDQLDACKAGLPVSSSNCRKPHALSEYEAFEILSSLELLEGNLQGGVCYKSTLSSPAVLF